MRKSCWCAEMKGLKRSNRKRRARILERKRLKAATEFQKRQRMELADKMKLGENLQESLERRSSTQNHRGLQTGPVTGPVW